MSNAGAESLIPALKGHSNAHLRNAVCLHLLEIQALLPRFRGGQEELELDQDWEENALV